MAYFVQELFVGLALGCVYALVALGFTIIFKASGVINFAQGEFLLVGTYIVSVAIFEWHLNFFIALAIGIAATVAIGLLFERFALRRMLGRPVFSIVMITIGLDILLLQGVTISVGSKSPSSPTVFGFDSSVVVGGVTLGFNAIGAIVVTILICAALYVFFRYTSYGLAMRATALDQEAALAMGIKTTTVYALAWGIAGAVATLGGILLLGISNPTFDITLGQTALLAFPAIILGGLDSIPGAVVGGIIIGLVQQLSAAYESNFTHIIGTGFHNIAPYLVMIVVLLVRPYGLFGTRKVERI
jgi:branched-chain amino acid transport system permease protein